MPLTPDETLNERLDILERKLNIVLAFVEKASPLLDSMAKMGEKMNEQGPMQLLGSLIRSG